jgi:hypothetical protein
MFEKLSERISKNSKKFYIAVNVTECEHRRQTKMAVHIIFQNHKKRTTKRGKLRVVANINKLE